MSHSNIVQNPTEVKLYAETLSSPSGEEHDVPSRFSHLIPEYANLCISGPIISKIIQEKGKKGNVIPKVFGLIALFAFVVMSANKSILPETANFATKLIHHEEISRSSTYNLPNLYNPLVPNIEVGKYTCTFKDSTSQPYMLNFVESMRREIGAREIDKYFPLFKEGD